MQICKWSKRRQQAPEKNAIVKSEFHRNAIQQMISISLVYHYEDGIYYNTFSIFSGSLKFSNLSIL